MRRKNPLCRAARRGRARRPVQISESCDLIGRPRLKSRRLGRLAGARIARAAHDYAEPGGMDSIHPGNPSTAPIPVIPADPTGIPLVLFLLRIRRFGRGLTPACTASSYAVRWEFGGNFGCQFRQNQSLWPICRPASCSVPSPC
jgi:hypothetical protein